MRSESMHPEAFRAIREGLGLSHEWLAEHLGKTTRTIERWEAGSTPVRPAVVEAMLMLEAEARDQVARHVESFESDEGDVAPMLAISEGPDEWPARWQRAIAFRVREYVPGLLIVGASE